MFTRRALLASLTTAAFALAACSRDAQPLQAPRDAASQSAPSQTGMPKTSTPKTSMIVFVDAQNCAISQAMLHDTEAFRQSAAARNITFVDTSTADGYALLSRYSVDGQAITHVPAVVTLRANTIVGGAFGRQSAAQLQQMLAAAAHDQVVSDVTIPHAARIAATAQR